MDAGVIYFILGAALIIMWLSRAANVSRAEKAEAEVDKLKTSAIPVIEENDTLRRSRDKLQSDLDAAKLSLSNWELPDSAVRLRAAERIEELNERTMRVAEAQTQLTELLAAITQADALLDDKEPVIYPRRFPEETSAGLQLRMDAIRDRQKEIRKKGQVVIEFGAATQSKLPKEVRDQYKSLVRLARLALEGAADTLLDQVKAANQARLEQKFEAVVSDLNRLLKPWKFAIGKNYQNTVRESLSLMAEYQQQVEREKDEQRALREQMREEAQALREAERAQKEAETEERRVERELARAQEAAAQATTEERGRWMEKVQQLEAALAAAHESKERAIAMAQLTRAGHVYIISNIGSFGDNVFKIGMTRRLDPLDRIQELGDASVPFPFDIHGLIRSDDAPKLENTLHRKFEQRRLNMVNERKEFFHVSFAEIQREITAIGLEVRLTELAAAEQFRQTKALRAGVHFDVAPLIEEHGAEEPADEDDDLPVAKRA